MVEQHIDFVARVVRNLGIPESEVDDAVQQTFIAAARRLEDIRPGSEKGFLFRTASHMAAHARRTLARRREVAPEEGLGAEDPLAPPDALVDQKKARLLFDLTLSKMDDDLRAVFVLFEVEELSTTEIAEAVGIPRGTVASRLRRARQQFRTLLAAPEAGNKEVAS
jgi:RNA polymerase sigma-70 factor (ECF subfamily)